MSSGLSEELLAIRLELKGVRETVDGLKATRTETEKQGPATRKVGEESAKASKKTGLLTKAFGALGKAARYGIGFLGVGAVFALHSAVQKTEELGKTTSALSRNLGFNTNVASRWGAVAQAREIDSKSLGMSFTTLSKKLTEAARKGGSALTPFHQLGISQEQVAKGAKNFQEGIMTVAKAFGEAKGGPERQAAAVGLLGKGWSTVLPLFSEGTKSLKEQLGWADKYGVTLSGKTTDGIMEMVNAQRENKVAMLGLQISITKALMPAIKAGDEQLQQFIATLNDPHLSAEQKTSRIARQFIELENKLFEVLEKMAPHIAEQAGKLGLKMAGALWHAFQNSDALGKLVIAAWIFKAFGGESLVRSGARKVGGRIGTEMGIGLATGAVGAFIAYEIWEHLSSKEKQAAERWGVHMGENFVNGLINIINHGIEEINSTMDEANFLSAIGVEAPNIGTIGEVRFGTNPNEAPGRTRGSNGEGGSSFNPNIPHGTFLPGGPEVKQPHRRRHPSVPGNRPRPNQRGKLGAFSAGAGRPIVLENVVNLDGKEIARNTTQHAEDEAALR